MEKGNLDLANKQRARQFSQKFKNCIVASYVKLYE